MRIWKARTDVRVWKVCTQGTAFALGVDDRGYIGFAVIGLDILRRFLDGGHSEAAKEVAHLASQPTKKPASSLAKRVIACLDVRSNDAGDLVVTKGDQYDVREQTSDREVRNLGKPVELAGRYFKDGADEVTFLNITGFRDFPLGDMPMLEVCVIPHGVLFFCMKCLLVRE
jgi:hypothetical protein